MMRSEFLLLPQGVVLGNGGDLCLAKYCPGAAGGQPKFGVLPNLRLEPSSH